MIKMADLKLKIKKCDFFKLQHLGHLIFGKISIPLPENLHNIINLTAQGCLRKSDKCLVYMVPIISKSLLIQILCVFRSKNHKTVPFIRNDQHHKAFDILKEALIKSPFIVYPDLKNHIPYFKDASKYVWSTY